MQKIDKKEILKLVINSLSESVSNANKSLNETNDNINDAPGAMQSHSDTTRSQLTSVMKVTHESYLSKVKELEILNKFLSKDINNISNDEVRIGSIINLKRDNGNITDNYFILPGGSGIKVESMGEKIVCITPISPLGKILLAKKKGQKFPYVIGNINQTAEVVDIF